MQELRIFNNDEFGEVRSVMVNEEPWFVGKDIAVALGYQNPQDAIKNHVDREDRIVGEPNATPYILDVMGRKQYPTWINESGLYSLILSSKLPKAKEFKHWVTSEVLPSIRKTGTYSANTVTQYPVSPAAMEGATNAGRLLERVMKRQGVPPHEIAMVIRSIFIQAGIDVPDFMIKAPAYEQLVLNGLSF